MGKYQEYGKKLDNLARQKFSEYEKVKENLDRAKKARSSFQVGFRSSPEDQLKAKRLEIEEQEAELKYKEFMKGFRSTLNQISAIRNELRQSLKNDLRLNPEDLDRNVVTLLESGICKAEEVQDLYNRATNTTTKRYIANHAKGMFTDKTGYEDRAILYAVSSNASALEDPDKSNAMQYFDVMTDVFKRCVNNPSMIGYWGELTEDAISEM